jgi:hypothetical protein
LTIDNICTTKHDFDGASQLATAEALPQISMFIWVRKLDRGAPERSPFSLDSG